MRCDYCGWQNSEGVDRCVKCNQLLSESAENQSLETSQVQNENPIPAEKSAPKASEPNIFQKTVTFQAPPASKVNQDPIEGTYCENCGYPLAVGMSECPACGASVETTSSSVKNVAQSINEKATIRDVGAISATIIAKKVESNSPNEGVSNNDMKRTIRDVRGVVSREPNTPSSAQMQQTVFGSTSTHHLGLKKTVRDVKGEELLHLVEKEANPVLQLDAQLIPMDNFDGQVCRIECPNTGITLNRGNMDPQNPTLDEKGQVRIEKGKDGWFIQNLSENTDTYIRVKKQVKLEAGDILVIGNRRYIFQ